MEHYYTVDELVVFMNTEWSYAWTYYILSNYINAWKQEWSETPNIIPDKIKGIDGELIIYDDKQERFVHEKLAAILKVTYENVMGVLPHGLNMDFGAELKAVIEHLEEPDEDYDYRYLLDYVKDDPWMSISIPLDYDWYD